MYLSITSFIRILELKYERLLD